ncbi:hypothetical protein KDW58_11440 [Burkholderia vietnamiensis]|nr:hypothetical protein [Burkholderia vietnamiensis]
MKKAAVPKGTAAFRIWWRISEISSVWRISWYISVLAKNDGSAAEKRDTKCHTFVTAERLPVKIYRWATNKNLR